MSLNPSLKTKLNKGLMMLNKKPRKRFKAIVWTKLEKKPFVLKYKEASFKDLNTKIHYPISSAYKGFSYLGGKSNKCRYA